MRLIYLRWLVIGSLAIAVHAQAATRPRYGGALRVETHAVISSIDPLQEMSPADASVRDSIVPLVLDTLTRNDTTGKPQPYLAARWQTDPAQKRWQFWLRRGVVMQDGSALTPAIAAQSLSSSLAGFAVRVVGESVVIESNSSVPGMLAELSLARNAIVVRNNGTVLGSGPFRIADFQPGRRLQLNANEDYWNGRPYLDSIDIGLGQSLRDQAMHFQLGRADVIEIAPDQVRRALQENRRVFSSSPSELIAIVVPSGTGAAENPRMREALSLTIDRGTIQNVLLQRQGDPTGAVLPQWMSGYAFLFPAKVDVARARQMRLEAGSNQPAIQLAYDGSDTIARTIAERVAVNARDAGIVVQAIPSAAATTQRVPRLVRLRMESLSPQAALTAIAWQVDSAQVPRIMAAQSIEELFEQEKELLSGFRLIPIAHVSQSYVVSPRVHDATLTREGMLPLDNVWVEAGQ